MSLFTVATDQDVAELANVILDPSRKKVICVITYPPSASAVRYDAQDIAEGTDKVCDVYLVIGSEKTWLLSQALPAEANVHSGAARTYPIGFGKTEHTAILRLAPSMANLQSITRQLEGDIWGAAHRGGLLESTSPGAVQTTVLVKMLLEPNGVMVELPNKSLAYISQDVVFPGVPVDWVYQTGQTLEGSYLPEVRQFIPAGAEITDKSALEHFGLNTVTYGLVTETDRQWAKIKLHPNLEFTVKKNRITGNDLDVITKYLPLGDIVEVRIYKDDHGKISLRLDDIDDEPISPALSLVAGGPAWLDPTREFIESETDLDVVEAIPLPEVETYQAEVEVAPIPATPAFLSPTANNMSIQQEQMYRQSISLLRGNLNAANQRLQNLSIDYRDAVDERNKSVAKLNNFISLNKDQLEELRELRKKTKATQKSGSTTFSRKNRWASNEEWFREEIRRAWIGRYTPSDRSSFRLDDANYSFGEQFFDYLKEGKMNEDDARKAVRAILDLVSGRHALEPSREAHAYLGDGAKPLMRNGDAGMRMHIENGVPQAKRLSYFILRDGGFELVKVADHDDMAFS
jgi:hypothetical protein